MDQPRTVCQPNCSMSLGAMSKPRRLPAFRPPKMYEVAWERRLLAMTRETMSVEAEGATPSPRPTAALDKHRPTGQGCCHISCNRTVAAGQDRLLRQG